MAENRPAHSVGMSATSFFFSAQKVSLPEPLYPPRDASSPGTFDTFLLSSQIKREEVCEFKSAKA